MKHSRTVLLTVSVSLGMLLIMFCIIAGRSTSTMAAPRLDYVSGDSFQKINLPMYQTYSCITLVTTTTNGLNNDDYINAVPLSDRNNLALVTGNKGDASAPAYDDWFRLDNASISSIYEVEVVPDLTDNYNLGITVYDDNLNEIMADNDPADDNRASITLVADSQGPYYFKVAQITPDDCSGGTYDLDVIVTDPTPTPTNTPLAGADPYEPNDTRGTAYVFPVVTTASALDANFVPSSTDQDWFAFYVKSGRNYRASTSNLVGVDTYVEVFHEDGSLIAYDNDSGGGFASRADWQASYDGYYYVKISNLVGTSTGSDTYDLTIAQVSVSATATPRPATSNPNADRCDKSELGNHDFDNACVISGDVSESFNFVPPPYGGTDNDFFKIWVKPGLLFKCGTSNLSAGVDPNLILYDHNRNTIGGNDDIWPGNFNSFLSYYATYEGWMYVLVGTGDRTPPNLNDSKYTLLCDMEIPGQATATSAPVPTRTPVSAATPTRRSQTATPTPSSSPTATPTPDERLTVRPLTTPTPVPVTTPAPRFVPIKLSVYYDGNGDQQPGAGEGIAGISVQVYEVATNQLLTQGYTDERGYLESTVAAQGLVRVSVPFFGFSQLVSGDGASIYLRVPPQPLSGGVP